MMPINIAFGLVLAIAGLLFLALVATVRRVKRTRAR
jgi:hypothetical protein